MRRSLYISAALLSAWLSMGSAPSVSDTFVKGATVAPLTRVPRVDGKISPGEWDRAVRTVGFQSYNNSQISCRMGSTYFGFSADRLYFAMTSEIPPNGKLISVQKNRDSDIIFDECLEIWIDPNRGTRAQGGDQRYYTFMMNNLGAVRDVCYDPSKGAPDVGWNGNWDVANGVDRVTGMWTAEASIPVSDLGMKPGDLVGRSIGVLQARNYKAGWWMQGTWFSSSGDSFDAWPAYPVMLLTKDAPTVSIETLGDKVFTGQLGLVAKIFNPGPARKAKVNLHITSSDMPGLDDEKLLDLPSNGSAEYAYNVTPGRLHEEATHTANLTVSSPDFQETYFNYLAKWIKAAENKWPGGFAGPNPEAAFELAYYPSYKFIRLKLDPRELGQEAEKITSGKATVTAPDGKTIISKAISWKDVPYVQEYSVPDLSDGDYTVTVTFDGWKDPLVRKFVRKHFPWEGNKLGITDKVLPPFEQVRAKGNTIDVVLRSYKMSGLGLPESVKTEGREILAGPIALKVNDGKAISGKGKITSTNPQAATFEGKASGPGVSIKTRTTTEYDGCMKVELDLLPAKNRQELKSLYLEIPIKDSEAPLWHVSTTGLRVNPAGTTPEGEGDVWDSRKFPDGNWYGNFKPYIWLGGEERGFCWFADNDRGWELDVDQKNPDNSAPCLVLHREKGVVTLRVNIIQKPVTITKARHIVFGLMASPAKPMAADWRRTNFSIQREGYECINHMGSEYWGADYPCSCKYPRNGDMSIIDAMRDERLGKQMDVAAFVAGWKERNFKPGMPVGKTDEKTQEILIGVSANTARGAGTKDRLSLYWEEFHSTSPLHEEVKTFQNEWSGTYGFGSTGALVSSYQDFACWWGAEFVKRGMGLYFDNAFPKRAYDPLTSSAYRLPNGDIQPSAGMWAHREYLRRIWVIHKTMSPPDLPTHMMIHMTNTHMIPYTVWSDSLLDLEWFYGPEPQQSKYAYDFLRAESIGRQSGSIPLVLAEIHSTKTDEEKAFIERTRFGTMMVHEIKARFWGHEESKLLNMVLGFGYGKDDCRVYNYWNDGYPVKMSNDQVKSILLKRGSELLLVVATWNQKPEKVKVTLDEKLVGLVVTKGVNEEKPEEVYPLDSTGAFTLELDGYGVRVIRLK